jgi:hypothetical protein
MSIVSSKIKSLKKRRFDEIKKKKTFLPTLIIALLLWVAFVLIILFVRPEGSGALQIFFGVFFGALAISLSLLLVNTRRGVAIATGTTFFLFLRYIGVGNILNFLLIIGAIAAFEFYLSNRD